MINEVFGELETSKPQPQIKILYISLNEISIRDKVEKSKDSIRYNGNRHFARADYYIRSYWR
jgi:hypothetical protein